MCVKAVIFDLDDTLIYSGIDYSGIKSSIIDFLVKSGVASNLLDKRMSNLEIIDIAVKELRRRNFTETGIREIIDKIYNMFSEAELSSIDKAKLMDEALETLAVLKNLGLRIGVVTNSCGEYAKRILKKFSLNRYIDALVTRDDVSRHKPDPEHLLKALEMLGVDVSETVFVGDHIIDSLCAKNSGVKFILFRNKKWDSKDWEKCAFAVIDHLSELPILLRQL